MSWIMMHLQRDEDNGKTKKNKGVDDEEKIFRNNWMEEWVGVGEREREINLSFLLFFFGGGLFNFLFR